MELFFIIALKCVLSIGKNRKEMSRTEGIAFTYITDFIFYRYTAITLKSH